MLLFTKPIKKLKKQVCLFSFLLDVYSFIICTTGFVCFFFFFLYLVDETMGLVAAQQEKAGKQETNIPLQTIVTKK
jgi:hypothetical protein